MPRDKIAYPNLRAEMARSNISIQDIANVIGTARDTAGAKLSRKRPINLNEAFEIADTFFPDKDVRYLFEAEQDIQPA